MKKKEYIAFGIVALGIGAFFIRGRNPTVHMPAETPASLPTGKGQGIQVLTSHALPIDTQKYQNELNRERAGFAQARTLGLKSLEFKATGDSVSVPLVFAPRKIWCQGGDLDTMRHASKDEMSKDFLITLEGIGRGGKNPSLRTSMKELTKGFSYTFTIPRPKATTSYGLYICTDSRNENSCQRKKIETHAQMSEQLAEMPDKAKAQDHVFFFQNLLIDGKKIEAYRSDDFSNDFQKSIGSHLSQRGLSASEVQAAWKANTALKSTPPDIRQGAIVLSLPYNDPRCVR